MSTRRELVEKLTEGIDEPGGEERVRQRLDDLKDSDRRKHLESLAVYIFGHLRAASELFPGARVEVNTVADYRYAGPPMSAHLVGGSVQFTITTDGETTTRHDLGPRAPIGVERERVVEFRF